MLKFLSFICILCLLISSCRSTKKIQSAIAKKDTAASADITANAKNDSIAYIKKQLGRISDQRIDFRTFSAKVDVDYEDAENKKYNVNAHLRMQKDSLIWISITGLLGIEGLRALITKDSVKLLNKQDKVYTERSVEYLQEVTALPLDLHSLQDLLIGNPVFLDSNIVSYSKNDNSISLLSVGELFRHLLTISDVQGQVLSSKLDDLQEMRARTCYLGYDDYETKKGFSFSTKRSITVSEKKKLDIRLHFKQYDFNETLSFPFSVPKNYDRN